MRDKVDRPIVLTGATGFLGAFLMESLLKKGCNVTVLGRASNGISLTERLSALCRRFGIEPGKRLTAIETDFSKDLLGLDAETYGFLCNNAKKLIHCASDTSFSERNRDRVMETNVNNTSALLKFAADSSIEKFYYISSAYASGVTEGICMEAPVTSISFTNVYEQSKAIAENIVLSNCENIGVPYVILRPSIVLGHSESGMSLRFNTLYHAVKSLLIIRDIFIKNIIEQEGLRSKKWGFSLDNNGTLHMTLNIRIPNKGFINLIPVDYFVDASLRIIEDSGAKGIYHLTSEIPSEITTLVDYAERFLNVRGVSVVVDLLTRESEQNPAEELFDKFISHYRPYLSDTRVFDRSRTNEITQGLSLPPFTYDAFKRCMDYAMENNWGKKT
ncbi:MAG: SDR family oxidoreductase [Acetivibrionales bacterium]|jgi:nucleoside-diphosphate-sugar epimerase